MAQFQVGDVVVLKSGGPRMTVTYLEEHGKVQCEWFGSHEAQSFKSSYAAAALEAAPASGRPTRS